jgi:hypothetical protein
MAQQNHSGTGFEAAPYGITISSLKSAYEPSNRRLARKVEKGFDMEYVSHVTKK